MEANTDVSVNCVGKLEAVSADTSSFSPKMASHTQSAGRATDVPLVSPSFKHAQ